MYKLVIADDEVDFRGRITKIVESSDTGFNLVGTYENGLDAYEGVVSNNPDILITDIKMPFMDGITLIKNLRRDFPLLKVIIVSGFDEFDYAKEAIDLEVVSYITKPITTKELKEILIKVKTDLDYSYEQKKVYNSLLSFKEQNYKKIYCDVLNNFLDESNKPIKNTKALSSININLDYKNIVLCNLELETNEYEVDDSLVIEDIIKETLSDDYKFETFTRSKSNMILIKSNDLINANELSYKLNEIIIKSRKFINKSITIGVSSFVNTNHPPYTLLNQTRQALSFKNVLNGEEIILFDDLDLDNNDELNLESYLQQIKLSIRTSNLSDVLKILLLIKNKMSNNKIIGCTLSFYISSILNIIVGSCQNQHLLYEKYSITRDLYCDINNAINLDDAFTIFNKVTEIVLDINKSLITNQIDRKLSLILEYIDKNYNKPIVLDDVAEQMDLTSNYICSLLKKHRSTTFVKYLTKVRMDKAIELLQTKKYKIVDVSMMVGYEDPFYFSHCFKKQMGISPKEFLNKQ